MAQCAAWKTYEEVAAFLLNQLAAKLGLELVAGKQVLQGLSGTNWEIDAKGVRIGDGGVVLIECRRYTTSRLPQSEVAELAYRIRDTEAVGGILVTPLDLQEGAKVVASHEGIQHIKLRPDSTKSDYFVEFLNSVFVGRSCHVSLVSQVSVEVHRSDGSIESKTVE